MACTRVNQAQPQRPLVLIFARFYLPGYRAGGPIHSVANLVAALKDEFDFRIVTSDRDLGDRHSYPGIKADAWQEVDGVRVLYLSPGPLRWWRIGWLLRALGYDMIYLNGFLPVSFSILPLWLWYFGMARQAPLLLAPRGEFSLGALALGASKKYHYLKLVKLIGLCKNVFWHASATPEKVDILRCFNDAHGLNTNPPFLEKRVFIGSNITAQQSPDFSNRVRPDRTKTPGSLLVTFVSRISRKKNLETALRILAGTRGEVVFNIYGPIEDAGYWAGCQQLSKELPPNVKVNYRGELAHNQVVAVFQSHHLFLFPTRGENFGHVIMEALSSGCPVLLSDQTPWRQLREKGVGWDLPLDQIAAFQEAIQECVEMDDDKFQRFSRQAEMFGLQFVSNPAHIEQNRAMFRSVLTTGT